MRKGVSIGNLHQSVAGFLAGMAKGIGIALLLSFVVSTSCHFSHLTNDTVSLERCKQALLSLPLSGIFTVALGLFKLGYNINSDLEERRYQAEQEERLNQLRQTRKRKITSAVEQLRSALCEDFKHVTDKLEFRTIIGYGDSITIWWTQFPVN